MANVTLVDENGRSVVFTPSAGGNQLPITPVPPPLLMDNFNGTVIDVTNRWNAPVLAGTGTMTQASGSLLTTLGTTANNAASISSIENFESTIGTLFAGALVQIEAAPALNTNRCFGFYTKPGSFTAATPVQDGYVWELDIAGTWGASIYSGGTRIFRQNFNLGGATFLQLAIGYQGLNVSFYFGSFTVPVLQVPFLQPSTLNLPFGFHSINHTAGPVGAPTWSASAIAVLDQSGVPSVQFNGQVFIRTRTPTVFVNINAVSVATEVTIWTPTTGRKFRLMGFVLETGVVGGNVLLKDNTAGATRLIIPFGGAGNVITSPPMGNGILSAAVNNVLTATGTATQTLSGYLFGTEE